MATYTITAGNEIEINFYNISPDEDTRDKMKRVKFRWDPGRKLWHSSYNAETLAVAKEICVIEPVRNLNESRFLKDYALKVKIRDIIYADQKQLKLWVKILKDYVNEVMSEDNSSRTGNSVSKSQESVWMDCFKFIAHTLSNLN